MEFIHRLIRGAILVLLISSNAEAGSGDDEYFQLKVNISDEYIARLYLVNKPDRKTRPVYSSRFKWVEFSVPALLASIEKYNECRITILKFDLPANVFGSDDVGKQGAIHIPLSSNIVIDNNSENIILIQDKNKETFKSKVVNYSENNWLTFKGTIIPHNGDETTNTTQGSAKCLTSQ